MQTFDHIIISTSNPASVKHWEEKLGVHVVLEEEPAGNGLGTLLAFEKAGIADENASIALIHTAGKGTRLAPLPASEAGNKAAVKLPGGLTLLEAVIRQIGPLAPARRGRLSVFWGDQLFLPKEPLPAPSHPVEIFCQRLPPLTEALWKERQLQHYGLLYLSDDGTAQQYDKATYSTIAPLIASGALAPSGAVSLGSFSIALPLVHQLLEACRDAKKLDADPHFWMPFSLDAATYPHDPHHYTRMQPLRQAIGATPIGDAPWLDFGRLATYFESCRSLLTPEGQAFRDLLGLKLTGTNILTGNATTSCDAQNSIISGTQAETIRARGSIIIDSAAPTITATDALLYNATDTAPIDLSPQEVRADVYLEDQHLPIGTDLSRDSGADWNSLLPGNPICFKDLHALNMNQDPQKVQERINTLRST